MSRFQPHLLLFALLATTFAADGQSCYWRSQSQIISEPSGWFACNNTDTEAGGAQLCCLNGAYCGEDSICHTSDSGGGSGWFVGGCTDGTYSDPVCRKSCTGDAQTWIEYNLTEQLWHCCGSSGCNGTPTAETFQAVAPQQWSAVPSLASSSATASGGGAATSTVTATASATGTPGIDTGLIAGVAVVASIAGLALVAGLAFLLLWRKAAQRRKSLEQELLRQREEAQQSQDMQQQRAHHETMYQDPAQSPYSPCKPPLQPGIVSNELGGDDGVRELSASRSP